MTQIKRNKIEILGTVRRDSGENAESRTVRGTAVVFDTPTVLFRGDGYEVREVVSRAAFADNVLEESDFLMTLFHDPARLLARSRKGEGTLRYEMTDTGIDFEFEAPHTADGDMVLEGIARGDLSGCSFWGFQDYDMYEASRTVTEEGDLTVITYTIKRMVKILDFTITPHPQYEETSVEAFAREAVAREKAPAPRIPDPKSEEILRRIDSILGKK